MKLDYKKWLSVSKWTLATGISLFIGSAIVKIESLFLLSFLLILISATGLITFKRIKKLHTIFLNNLTARRSKLISKLPPHKLYKFARYIIIGWNVTFLLLFTIGVFIESGNKGIFYNILGLSVGWFVFGGWLNSILIYQKYKLDYIPTEIKSIQQRLKEQMMKEVEAKLKIQKEKAKFEKEKTEKEDFRKKQLSKGLIEYKNKWYTKSEFEKVKSIEIGLSNNFLDMNPYEFESFIAKLFEKMGYKIQLTPKSQDYGIDVVAKGYGDVVVIQCKRFGDGNNVGNRDIQMARGSMDYYNANKCIVITNQDFTINAKEQARRTKNMELWGRRELHKMVKRYFIENFHEQLKPISPMEK